MPDEEVDQAFFGWAAEKKQLTLLADSFARDEEAARWLYFLQAHVRLQPVPGATVPSAAFSYFRYGDRAVVLRRTRVGASAGRNNSHALIGPAEVLSPVVAIGLEHWPHWLENRPESDKMPSLRSSLIAGSIREADRVRSRVARCEEIIALVATHFFGNPGRPLSIVGCPEEDRLTVVWGLRELALRSGSRAPQPLPDWTFSTYEDRHDVAVDGLPWIVFLPVRPQGVAVVNRAVLDLAYPDVNPDGLAWIRPHVRALTEAHPAKADPEIVISGSLPPPAPPGPVSVSADAIAKDDVRRLNNSLSLNDFHRNLKYLEQHYQGARSRLREALDVAAMDQAARFVEVETRTELLGRLLRVAYGPRLIDLHEAPAAKHAAKLLETTQSDQLALMIGTDEQLDREWIRGAILRRWSAGRAEPSEVGPRMLRRLRRSRLSRYVPGMAAIALAAVLALAFAVGFVVGRPGSTGAAAVRPPAASPSSAATGTNNGLATLRSDPGRQAFAFSRHNDGGLWPRGACNTERAGPDGSTVWRCPASPLPEPNGSQLIAILVPTQQVEFLKGQAAQNAPLEWAEEWGASSPVG